MEKVVKIFDSSRKTYGYPRVHAALVRSGVICSRNRVARLMRDYGLQARMARKFKKHSYRHRLIKGWSNLLLRRKPVKSINEVWVCDVTFVRVKQEWNYLCTVMDLYSRKIIGWHFSKNNGGALAKEAVLMARENNQPKEGAIFHTDQGIEFANKEVHRTVEESGLRISKSRKGCCWDNANMESFYHTLKTEMIYFQKFKSLVEAVSYIMDYMYFYNNERLHSGLGYRTPLEYEKLAA